MKDKTLAGILAIFCGTIGLHKFYLSKYLMGVIYILFSWTLIPTLLGVIEGIRYLMMTDTEFEEKYSNTTSTATEKKDVSNQVAKSDIADPNESEVTNPNESKLSADVLRNLTQVELCPKWSRWTTVRF